MNKLHLWFLEQWDKNEEFDENNKGYIKCFETGKKLYTENYREISLCYSHILNKKKYSKYKMKDWNLKIVSPESHQLFELYPKKAIHQYTLYQKLLEDHYNKLI